MKASLCWLITGLIWGSIASYQYLEFQYERVVAERLASNNLQWQSRLVKCGNAVITPRGEFSLIEDWNSLFLKRKAQLRSDRGLFRK